MSEHLSLEERDALNKATMENSWPEELTDEEKKIIDTIVKKHDPCWGTGRIGFREDGKPIVCRCVWKAWGQTLIARQKALDVKSE